MIKKNNLTLIVDGNWLLMSRFYVMTEYFKIDNDDETKELGTEKLASLLAQSISVTLRKFNNIIDNIILVSDIKTWRKELTKPSSFKAVDYKGNRSQDAKLDMKYVFKSIDILFDRFTELGITASRVSGAEGDDWCWYWSKNLTDKGINTILWTTDEDIKQLVDLHPVNGSFTAWYNDKSGIVFNKSIEHDYNNDIDFFLVQEFNNYTYNNIKKLPNIKINYIEPHDIIVKKILLGDAGDNIMPIFNIIKPSGKIFKATEKDYQKIDQNIWKGVWKYINSDNDKEVDEFLVKLYNRLTCLNKCKSCETTTLIEFMEHYYYNKRLVWLDESQIPDTVISEMNNTEYLIPTKDIISSINMNHRHIERARKDMEKLFDSLDV